VCSHLRGVLRLCLPLLLFSRLSAKLK